MNKITNNEMILMVLSVFVLVGFFVYMQQSSSIDSITVNTIKNEINKRDSIHSQKDSVLNIKISNLSKRVLRLEKSAKNK